MDLLEVGKIINTHGLRGEVKVAAWTDTPDVFEDLEYVYAKRRTGNERLTIAGIKYQKNNIIVKFDELKTIEEAEKLKNTVLCAERAMLGELPEGVYYIADLLGCTVRSEEGKTYGTISDVISTGANDVYTVKREGMKDLLVPVTDEVVINVDIASKTVTVRLPEGLEEI